MVWIIRKPDNNNIVTPVCSGSFDYLRVMVLKMLRAVASSRAALSSVLKVTM